MKKREAIIIVAAIFITYFLGLFVGYKMREFQEENKVECQQEEEKEDVEDYISTV